MISNERPSPYGRRPYQQSQGFGNHGNHQGYNQSGNYGQPRPHVQEDTLKTGEVQIERKTFVFTLKENPRGRFLRITEDANGRRDSIVIPAPGLEDFRQVLDEIIAAHREAGEPPV